MGAVCGTGGRPKESLDLLEINVDPTNCRIALGNPVNELDMQKIGPLYEFQDKLPTLPVPDYKESAAIYLKSTKPLVKDEAEYALIEAQVNKFCEAGGVGEKLQKRLLEKNEFESKKSSWLATWWNVNQYLLFREPLPINVSYYIQIENKLELNQMQLASQLAYQFNILSKKVNDASLPQDNLRGKTPLCASAYKYVFNTCRIPAPNQDVIGIYDRNKYNHIVVLSNNCVYKMELHDDMTADQIMKNLEFIKEDSKTQSVKPLGVLTAVHRDFWTKARMHLISKLQNKASLQVIESAIFSVCLDDHAPDSQMNSARQLLLDDGTNRWYDKTIQLIVFANGRAGLYAEHALIDATVISRLLTDAMTEITAPNGGDAEYEINKQHPQPSKISFDYDSKLESMIVEAQGFYKNFIGQHHVHTEVFSNWGSSAIKKMGFSPDAFVQMSIQYAYRKMSGHFGATYESVQVRHYKHARTECVRSCSEDSAAWINAMLEGTSGKEKEVVELMKKAAGSHTTFTKLCQGAKACDRHLYGLKQMLLQGESCEMMEYPLYGKSGTWEISTSNVSNDFYEGFGFGQVCSYGIGCGYIIKADTITYNCTTRQDKTDGSPEAMCQALNSVLMEMQALVEAAQ